MGLKANCGTWQGTAKELADLLASICQQEDFADLTPPTVRLIRDYCRRGIITTKGQRGRRRIFGFRQIIEFLAARRLIADGYSLRKVSKYIAQQNEKAILQIIEDGEKLHEQTVRHKRSDATAEQLGFQQVLIPIEQPTGLIPVETITQEGQEKRRLERAIRGLGLDPAIPRHQDVVQLTLAPWCQVYLDRTALVRSGFDAPDRLGTILVHEARQILNGRGKARVGKQLG